KTISRSHDLGISGRNAIINRKAAIGTSATPAQNRRPSGKASQAESSPAPKMVMAAAAKPITASAIRVARRNGEFVTVIGHLLRLNQDALRLSHNAAQSDYVGGNRNTADPRL